MNKLAQSLIKKHEGLRLYPYKCTAGKLTIGYGTNLDVGITEEIALYLMNKEIEHIESHIATVVPCYNSLDKTRQAVIISMAYNLGLSGLSKFKNTIHYICEGNYEQAALNMLDSLWSSQVHGRAVELAELMRKGETNG